MRIFLLFAFILVMITSYQQRAQAHICLTYPLQRGPAPTLQPGDDACYNRIPNCGSLPKGPPTATFIQGVPTSVQLQQNLNHFYNPKPGFLDMAVSYDNEQTWTTLTRIDDFAANNMDSQVFLNFPGIVFPSAGPAILRGRYVSYNVNEIDPANNTDAIFYSCADINVVGGGSSRNAAETVSSSNELHRAAKKNNNNRDEKKQLLPVGATMFSCKTPARWIASGVEFAGEDEFLTHTILYDSVSGWVKWEKSNEKLGGQYDRIDLWNLTMSSQGYTPQFVIGLKGKGSCSLFGGDRFFGWQFGLPVSQLNMRNETDVNGNQIIVFQNIRNGFTWKAKYNSVDGTCLPTNIYYGSTEIRLNSTAVSSIAPFNFAIPSYCHQGKSSVEELLPDAGCKAHARRSRRHQ